MENEENLSPTPVDTEQFEKNQALLDSLDESDEAVLAGGEPAQPQAQQPQATEQATEPAPAEEASDDQLIPQIQAGTADLGDFARFGMEMGGSPVAGVADFAVDAVNLIPGVDVPKLPKYQNDLATGLRQLTSLIAPNVFIAGRVVKGIQGATKGYAFAQSALAKWRVVLLSALVLELLWTTQWSSTKKMTTS